MRQSFGVSHTKFVLFLADEFRRKRDQKAWVLVKEISEWRQQHNLQSSFRLFQCQKGGFNGFVGVFLFFQKDHSIRRTL